MIAKGCPKKVTGRGPRSKEVDQELFEWYNKQREDGSRPKSRQVQAKAKDLYEAAGFNDIKV